MGSSRGRWAVALCLSVLFCSLLTVAAGATDPTESTEITDPTESTEITDPTESTEITDPTESTEITEITEPIDATGEPSPGRPLRSEAKIGDLATEEFEADRTRFRITVRQNGSGEWTFQYEQRLETDDAVGEFEAYAERFNSEETESYRNFRARSTALTASGSNVTGRQMAAESFDREARVEERPPAGDEFGVVEMSFVWTGFAESDGDRLVVGDVFVDGLYVGPDQQLRFDRGPTLRFESVDPNPDSMADGMLAESESVTWLGEAQFTDRRPRVVYILRDSGPGPVTDQGSEPTSTGTPGGTGLPLPLVVLAVVVVVGAGSALAYRSGVLRTVRRSGVPFGDTEADSAAAEETAEPPEPGAEHEPGPADEDAGRAGEADARHGEFGPVAPAVSDEELRSDDERVISLLEERGGRMRQVDIVANTDWSKSKVSMLLSGMEEEGVISRLRVGRENIVSLAGHEPDAAGSPFENEK